MFFSVLIGKILVLIGKILHKGSSKPGEVVLKMNKNFFKNVKLPKKVIAVTGSSGKGSISTMIAEIYRKAGKSVAHNSKGANLSSGIATLLIENCNLKGEIKKDVLVIEVDERFAKYLFPDVKPNYVVITNICRDQPPRQGNVDIVYEEIEKALTSDMHLILNADDPYLQKFALADFEVTYYSMNKNKYSYEENIFESLNIYYCPKCGRKLNYNFYHFETLGDYDCPGCDLKRPKADYVISNVDYDNSMITINDNYQIHVPFAILYAIYNTTAAFVMAAIDNLPLDTVVKTINESKTNTKINNSYNYKNRIVNVLSNKNENSTTFNQSILFTKRENKERVILIGWKEISRRYIYNDLSWLYDISFEQLNDQYTTKVFCVGENRYDIAVRLKYAGFDENKLAIYEKLEDAVSDLKQNTNGNIYAIVNFDYVDPFNNLMMVGDKNGR